eukprot:466889-Karenia_brevis.AAC.1
MSSKDGDSSCACLGIEFPGTVDVWPGTDKSAKQTFPASYGATCDLGWCWVDPCKCSLAMTKSTQMKINKKGKALAAFDFHHMPGIYSYATCGNSGDTGDDATDICYKYAPGKAKWDTPLLGLPSCPCAGWYGFPGSMDLMTESGPPTATYPTITGGECMLWDKKRHPLCTATTGDIPDWCGSKWCWVDPDNCDIPGSPPVPFTRDT